ncbi:hypothetical protein NG895_26570 [Aeoliella sp. ICT_H6.2]|uniref:Uncharacterized protein n=1 Tax=Aeoliella straminimaris TaxID=2954799 RepID=A0A9X2FFU9_9BACT|nr:hypothetical protein [Aeoliella straminimaris]MCO6047483.1 hypothetical protein [Aeoliella straminimaris]
MVRRTHILLLAVGCLALTGCQSMPWTRTASNDAPKSPTADLPMAIGREGSSLATPEVQQAASFADPNALVSGNSNITPLSGQELSQSDEVLRELNTIGAVDPVAAQQLVERLQETKPSLRPLVARQFRTSWQYHRERFGGLGDTALAQESQESTDSVTHVAQMPSPADAPAPPPTLDQPPTTYLPSEATPAAEQAPPQPADSNTGPPSPPGPQASAAVKPLKQDAQVQQAAHVEPVASAPPAETKDTPGGMEVEEPRSWQEVLGQSIDKLADDVVKDPHNTDEAYQHVLLRMMQLVAGDKEQALEPIPGLTPTEQSYWTNQLFAIATLLDHQAMPDEEARAALAAEQLAEAAARLGELSNLEVRNLAFCKRVYGYGDFDRQQEDSYKPGQQVTLYAEVDNFRSESTDKGYHTALATSYEVLDQAGNRVEGGEFATVEDYCSRKRQDFFIEYTVQLPKQIYASKYELRLTIRDRLSGKIGKSSIAFEIVE